jgi:prepilin-type N-terminal cleavage/methylation domain-containing protein
MKQKMTFASTVSPRYHVGFTIVELLIVIVVIGILAAIVIVAYNGVVGRANDAAVQSDLKSIATKINLFNADNNKFPSVPADLTALAFTANKSPYALAPKTQVNMIYCYDSTTASANYAVLAQSTSGKKFIVGSNNALSEYLGSWTNSSSANCTGVSAALTNNLNGYLSTDNVTGPWRAWTGGS